MFLGGIVCNNGGKLIKDLRAVLGANFPILVPDGFTPFSATDDRRRGTTANGAVHQPPGHPDRAAEGRGQEVRQRLHEGQRRQAARPVHGLRGAGGAGAPRRRSRSPTGRARRHVEAVQPDVTNGILGNFSIDKNGDTTLGTVTFGQMNGQGRQVRQADHADGELRQGLAKCGSSKRPRPGEGAVLPPGVQHPSGRLRRAPPRSPPRRASGADRADAHRVRASSRSSSPGWPSTSSRRPRTSTTTSSSASRTAPSTA